MHRNKTEIQNLQHLWYLAVGLFVKTLKTRPRRLFAVIFVRFVTPLLQLVFGSALQMFPNEICEKQ
jgi:hypothetical protein